MRGTTVTRSRLPAANRCRRRREELFGVRKQTISDDPALQREPQTESVAPAHEDDTAETGAPAQSKRNSVPIQRNKSPGKAQKKSYVPYQVAVDHVMTQDEFKTAAMTQVFGGPLTGLVWQNLRGPRRDSAARKHWKGLQCVDNT